VYPGGHPIGFLWGIDTGLEAQDPETHPVHFENEDLIVVLSAYPGGWAENANGCITLMAQGRWGPAPPFPVTLSDRGEAQLKPLPIPQVIPGPSWRAAAHALGHSLGLGVEYDVIDGRYDAGDTLYRYGNLQLEEAVADPADPGKIDPAKVKWNWHRVRKAAVLTGKPQLNTKVPDPKADELVTTFRVPVRPQDARRLELNDWVLLRKRVRGKVLGGALDDDGVPLPIHVLPTNLRVAEKPASGEVVVRPADGVPIGLDDMQEFGEGDLLFAPVQASSGSEWARMISPAIAEQLAAGMLSPPNPDCRATGAESVEPLFGVTLPPSLPQWHLPRIVGVYQGGHRHACGVVHPAGTCMMRGARTSMQFCAVCSYVLVDLIDPAKHAEIDRDYEMVYPLT
jgi:hypothetical protein